MLSRRTDFPIHRDSLSSFLPWLIAFMVFLGVLALAGMLALDDLAARWDRGMAGTLTVQAPAEADAADGARRVAEAVRLLTAVPEVARAAPVPAAAVASLLAPWLGGGEVAELPLPYLIDVELLSGAEVDAEALRVRLAGVLPGVTVDDHRVWLDRILRLIRAAEMLALAVLSLIGLSMIGTVVFTTRSGLAVHREAIELLHLIGAQDTYVARQFAGRALWLGMKGGLMGLLMAGPTLAGLVVLARRVEPELLPEIGVSPLTWGLLAAPPLATALIATVTARITVVRTLTRML